MDFHFKQFSIAQDRCAMKIGTDGVLLGAWTKIPEKVNSILDIGTGTGLLALMLAQRSGAGTIDALEIEENAYEQAVDNFENSPWGDRLFCYHASFEEFVEEMQDEKYDLIVCNPPFYKTPMPSASFPNGEILNKSRQLARFQDSLPFERLVWGISKLISKNGIFSIIIPNEETDNLLKLAEKHQLFLQKLTEVQGTKNSPVKRCLLSLSLKKGNIKTNALILEKKRHQYTDDYEKMVKPFYLKL